MKQIKVVSKVNNCNYTVLMNNGVAKKQMKTRLLIGSAITMVLKYENRDVVCTGVITRQFEKTLAVENINLHKKTRTKLKLPILNAKAEIAIACVIDKTRH